MEKYSQIANHLRNGKLVLSGDGDQLNLKVSSIVDGAGGRGDKPNIPLTMAYRNSINGLHDIGGGGSSEGGPATSNQTNHNVINDLIPYPSSAISTIIEKVNGTDSVYFESGRIVNHNHNPTTRSPGQPQSPLEGTKRRSKLESNRLKKAEAISFENTINHDQSSPATSTPTSQVQTVSQQSSDEKVVVCNNSNSSNNKNSPKSTTRASFDSDDIVRIVKLLQEKRENSTQTEERQQPVQQCNQYVQVSFAEEEGDASDGRETESAATDNHLSRRPSTVAELTRSNQTLRGTVDQLSYIVEQMSKERSATTLQMHSLSKTVTAREAKIAELVAEREKVLADNDELRFAMRNIESLLADYQSSLAARAEEAAATRKDLAAAIVERTDLLSTLEQTRAELRTKDDLLAELYRVNALNQQEMASARAYCAGLAEQLTRSSAEAAATLLATKTDLERRLEEVRSEEAAKGDHRLLQERQSSRQRLQSVQANCADLRTNLHALRASTVEELQSAMAEWTARKDDIVRRMEVASLLSSCSRAYSVSNERFGSPKPLSRLHTSIEDIKNELQNIQESLTLPVPSADHR